MKLKRKMKELKLMIVKVIEVLPLRANPQIKISQKIKVKQLLRKMYLSLMKLKVIEMYQRVKVLRKIYYQKKILVEIILLIRMI